MIIGTHMAASQQQAVSTTQASGSSSANSPSTGMSDTTGDSADLWHGKDIRKSGKGVYPGMDKERACTQAGVEAAELVVVSRCVDLEVRTSYARYEQLTRIAADCGAKVLDTGFADEVTLRLRMLDGTQAPLLAKLTELERGQERVRVSDPVDAAF